MAEQREQAAPAEPSTSGHSAEPSAPWPGWLPPGAPTGHRRGWLAPLAIGCAFAAAVFLAGPLIFLAIYNLSSPAGPSMQAIQFGEGGSQCTIATTSQSFAQGTPVRIVATFSPALPSGSSVLITLHRDGTELTGSRETVRIDEPSDCIYGEHTDLTAGHYRIVYELESSAMPPLSGDFDVTAP
jgi:hypothetical protein